MTTYQNFPTMPLEQHPDLPIAVVIGAGGLSMAIAQRLGQSHRIVLVSLDPAELERGAARLQELGVSSRTLVCDITQPPPVAELGNLISSLGQVTTLAHVAALSPSVADWRRILLVNLVGAARVEETLHPAMARYGAAIFISSLAAHGPEPSPQVLAALDAPLAEDFLLRLESAVDAPMTSGLGYSLSKLGLNRLVQQRASAWGKRDTRILSISPGLIATPMGAREDARASKDAKARLRCHLPLQRDGTMAEIADAVEFLTSRRASYITGTDLLVDGGLSAALRFAAS
jgi:NAD(P)-dependent dehydrogenase (short-subunit alcohol dehydrogenase family)